MKNLPQHLANFLFPQQVQLFDTSVEVTLPSSLSSNVSKTASATPSATSSVTSTMVTKVSFSLKTFKILSTCP